MLDKLGVVWGRQFLDLLILLYGSVSLLLMPHPIFSLTTWRFWRWLLQLYSIGTWLDDRCLHWEWWWWMRIWEWRETRWRIWYTSWRLYWAVNRRWRVGWWYIHGAGRYLLSFFEWVVEVQLLGDWWGRCRKIIVVYKIDVCCQSGSWVLLIVWRTCERKVQQTHKGVLDTHWRYMGESWTRNTIVKQFFIVIVEWQKEQWWLFTFGVHPSLVLESNCLVVFLARRDRGSE